MAAGFAAKASSGVLRSDSTVALAGRTGYLPGMLFWKGACLVWTMVWPGALTAASAAPEPAGSPWRAEAAVTAPGYAWLPWLGLGAAGTLVVLGFLWWRNRSSRRKLKQPALELPLGEARYRTLFDNTPVQILEEDFTAVADVFARLRTEGVTDLFTFLAGHPNLPREWLGLVRLADANRPAVAAAGFAEKAEMAARFPQHVAAPYLEVFSYQVTALWAGRRRFEEEFRYLDMQGQERACLMQCQVAERAGQPDLSRVVLVLLDVTTAKRTTTAQMENQDLLRQILAGANILLWWASVRREGGHLRWRINIPSQSFDSPLFQLATARDRGGLWEVDHAPDLPETTRRAEQALLNNRPDYQQEFRVLSREGITHWLSEEVGISRLAEDEWSLVGVVTDITARHEAEEARKASEAQLQQILARADCMLWRANVVRKGEGTQWRSFDVPASGLHTRLQNVGVISSGQRLWPREYVPERPEMDARAEQAIFSGAPGYEQDFRVIKDQQSFWMHEQVMIIPVGPDEWNLVGVLMDVTAQHEAEEVRKASEAQLRQVLERADCLLWQAHVVENAAGVLDWFLYIPRSRLYRELFGNDPSEHPNLMWSELNVPELAAMNARSTAAIRDGAPGYEQEFRAVRIARTYWLHEQVSITAVGPGKWNLVGVITNVTAQHEAEEARKTSEAQLRQILTRADCLLWQANILREDGGVRWRNFTMPSSGLCERLFGAMPPTTGTGLWLPGDTPDLPEMNRRSTEAILSGAPGYEQEFRVIRPERTLWLHEQVSITPASADEWSLVGVITDISARREAESALAAEKERLIVTLRAMTEGVITTDTRGVVQFMNRAAAELTQQEAATAVGRPLAEICILHEAPSNRVFTLPVMSVLEEGVLVDLPPQIMLVGRKGATCRVEGCCIPVREANSELIGTVLVLRDVTVRQRFEQELQRASRLESVGILAGGIAHDFNNILTAIMGNVTLALLDAEALSKAERYLREAERATLRARDLTQQLLTFAKGGDPVRSAVLLPEIIAETTQFALHGSRVKCEFDLPANLWPADADKAQLGQVVQNLVINAIQAMPEGGTIRISAHNEAVTIDSHRSLAPGDYVHLIVTDTGTGIRAEHLVKIFDPYFTTKQQGSGLGLTTVYSIIKKHNGHIEVESELGRGTTFHLWLPALREQQLDLPEQQKETMASLKGRVLFMDDEEPIVQMASTLLQRLGFEVEVTRDGAEVVKKFKAAHAAGRPFDLVVMDLTVPGGMGGREAIEQLRLIDPSVKAVVSSGYSSDPVLANYRAYGFRGMVAKPYKITDFTRVLREVMSGSRPPIPMILPGQPEGR
jgi:signal transduction histidine kinase/CheY-like chemotaxis protein